MNKMYGACDEEWKPLWQHNTYTTRELQIIAVNTLRRNYIELSRVYELNGTLPEVRKDMSEVEKVVSLDIVLCRRPGSDFGCWYLKKETKHFDERQKRTYKEVMLGYSTYLGNEGIPLREADEDRWSRMIGLVIVGLAERIQL